MRIKRYGLLSLFFLILLQLTYTEKVLPQDPFDAPSVLPEASSDMSQGVAFADYNTDGWVDLYVTRGNDSIGASYVNYLYLNSNGSLSQTTISGMTDDEFTSGTASWADVDNDGYLDLYVAAAQAGQGASPPENNLYMNDGSGGFNDQTGNSSYGDIVTQTEDSRHVGFGDRNNDGYPDVYIDNGRITMFGEVKGNNTFYGNDGDGTFTELTESDIGRIVETGTSQSDAPYRTFGSGFGWTDYNNDGYQDIFNCGGGGAVANKLWENNPSTEEFDEVTPGTMQPTQTSFLSCSWGDYDNDGDMDLYACNMIDGNVHYNYLYRNESTTSTAAFDSVKGIGGIVSDAYEAVSSAWGDIDNDGDLDIFVTNRPDNQQTNIPATLYTNDGASSNYTFTTAQNYLDPSTGNNFDGRGVAFADIDNDGFLDMVTARDAEPLLYMNSAASSNGFTMVKIRGSGSTNTHALGSRIYVVADIPEQNGSTTQLREISGQTGGGGQNDLRAHFGLGTASKIDSVYVRWFNSSGGATKSTNTYTDIPTDKIMIFKEGDLNVTSDVIPNQTFMYLFGNTGGSVELTANSDSDGGTLTVQRTDSDPGNNGFSGSATSPDGTTVTPNVVSPDRYWTVSESGLSGNFTASVYVDISGMGGINDADKLLIVKRASSSDPWTALDTERIGNTLYTTGQTSFSEYAVASNSNDNSLPVQLVSFQAASGDQQVTLSWKTASEVENMGFIIQRARQTSQDFKTIVSYKTHSALKGRGNSSDETQYRFVDEDVRNGQTYYYRLIDVDFSGEQTIHNVVEAQPKTVIQNVNLMANYPNPFNPYTSIRYQLPEYSEVELAVYDLNGKKIATLVSGNQEAGQHRVEWQANDMPSGVYIYRLSTDKQTQSRKMILLR